MDESRPVAEPYPSSSIYKSGFGVPTDWDTLNFQVSVPTDLRQRRRRAHRHVRRLDWPVEGRPPPPSVSDEDVRVSDG